MIFKQRLFTLLLGLLFTTVLTDQASALYDPGVGRFCSRDPIGYADHNNAYTANFIPHRADPSGMLAIDLVTKLMTVKAGCCIIDIWDRDSWDTRITGRHASIRCSNGIYASFYPHGWEDIIYDHVIVDGIAQKPPRESLEICCLDLNAMKQRLSTLKQVCYFDSRIGWVCTTVVADLLYAGSDNKPKCRCGFVPDFLLPPNGDLPGYDAPLKLLDYAKRLKENGCKNWECVLDWKYHPPTDHYDPKPWGNGPKF